MWFKRVKVSDGCIAGLGRKVLHRSLECSGSHAARRSLRHWCLDGREHVSASAQRGDFPGLVSRGAAAVRPTVRRKWTAPSLSTLQRAQNTTRRTRRTDRKLHSTRPKAMLIHPLAASSKDNGIMPSFSTPNNHQNELFELPSQNQKPFMPITKTFRAAPRLTSRSTVMQSLPVVSRVILRRRGGRRGRSLWCRALVHAIVFTALNLREREFGERVLEG